MLQKQVFLQSIKTLTATAVALFIFVSCHDDNDAGSILVSVSDECIAEIRLFTMAGDQLDVKDWDCQETKVLTFSASVPGLYLLYAETPSGRKVKQPVQVVAGKTTETTLIFE